MYETRIHTNMQKYIPPNQVIDVNKKSVSKASIRNKYSELQILLLLNVNMCDYEISELSVVLMKQQQQPPLW